MNSWLPFLLPRMDFLESHATRMKTMLTSGFTSHTINWTSAGMGECLSIFFMLMVARCDPRDQWFCNHDCITCFGNFDPIYVVHVMIKYMWILGWPDRYIGANTITARDCQSLFGFFNTKFPKAAYLKVEPMILVNNKCKISKMSRHLKIEILYLFTDKQIV